jgi:hypothetical protein
MLIQKGASKLGAGEKTQGFIYLFICLISLQRLSSARYFTVKTASYYL